MSKCRTRQPGLTLVELMLSLALTTMLMVAVLGSLTSLTRSETTLAGSAEFAWQADRLQELLRRDLQQATSVSFGQDGLRCQTLHSIDLESGGPAQLPCQVRYVSITKAGRSWLCREEQTRVAGVLKRELVGPDLQILQMQALEAATDKPAGPLPGAEVPTAVTIRISGGKNGQFTQQWQMALR